MIPEALVTYSALSDPFVTIIDSAVSGVNFISENE
jgi:hypothetical protein